MQPMKRLFSKRFVIYLSLGFDKANHSLNILMNGLTTKVYSHLTLRLILPTVQESILSRLQARPFQKPRLQKWPVQQ